METRFPLERLGNYCLKIGSGATPKGGKEVYLDKGEIALIRSQNVYNNQFVLDGLAYITPEAAQKLDGVAVEADDVLLNITGDSVARCCSVPNHVLPARVNQHVAIIRPKPDEFVPRFVQYFLVSPNQQDRMLKIAGSGGTRNALTKGMIENFSIPKPIIEVQRSIAKILGDLDDKIDLLRAMNRTLEAIARAVFRAWFVNFEPVRAKAAGATTFRGMPQDIFDNLPDEFEGSPVGHIPKGWNADELGSLVELRNERVKAGAKTEALPYVPIDCIEARSIWLMQEKPGAEAQSSLVKVYPNDILFGAMRPYFHKICIMPFEATTRTTVFVLTPKRPADLYYSLMVLSEDKTVDFATTSSIGSTIPYAKWEGVLERMEIALPPYEIRKAYGDSIAPIVERGMRVKREVGTLARLRDELLPRLISGKLEAPSLEALGLKAASDGG